MKKWMVWSLAVAVAGLAVLFFVTAPSDDQLVRQAIDESTRASREGRPGGVLEYLSPYLAINADPMIDRSDIARVVRLSKPEVRFGPYAPQIDGEAALVRADVAVKMSFQGLNIDTTFHGVQVKLTKTTGVRWLFLPGSKWKITEVAAPDLDKYTGGLP